MSARPRTHHRQSWTPRPPTLGSEPHRRHGHRASSSAEVPQLVQEIEEKLSRGAAECMICYDTVRRSSPVWSCSSCFSIFHLHCVRRWSRSPAAASSASDSTSSWRCPGCQSVQSADSNRLTYTCFCGRLTDPPNDLFVTPHSCGEPCGKPLTRDGDGDALRSCQHVCVLRCHPGPCPPCKSLAPRRPCPCGRTTIVRRCSDRSSPLTCASVCDRLLSCGLHRCARRCHAGPCDACAVPVPASCFCGDRTETVLCGGGGEGVFSCGSQCGRSLSCGNHHCREPCHPGPCGECELAPGKTGGYCCCGKSKLETERMSCLDHIPTCSGTCDKPLACGLHRCSEKCHEGPCPRCFVPVDQRCRCGSSRRTVECYVSTEERDKFICDKPCGRKKNCGRHRCSERCCPLSRPGSVEAVGGDWDPHLCSVPCGKRLVCGQHACQLLCHSGHCPPCLETLFSDLSCACGRTSIPPPIPCGTPVPLCPHPCSVSQPCGHPASHACHSGDCLPCSVPVTKECIGGHVLLRNIPCGSKDVRCNQLCGKTRKCGIHACTRTCHPLPCDPPSGSAPDSGGKSSCGQVCGAPRRDCKHTCRAPCHPSSPCPDIPCEFPATIACSCGRITATVPCGAAALGLRRLTCDEECGKLARKRQLAEAFDITNPNVDSLHFGENSAASDLLADLLRREPKWVLAVEERFRFLVLGKAKGATDATGLRVHVFSPALKEKRDAIQLIAERWKFSVQAAGWEPKRFLAVHATSKSRPPSRILGAKPGVPATLLHPLPFDPVVDMDPRLVVAMLDLPTDADVSSAVLRFGGECELVWLNDKNALAVFGDPTRAATALRRLDHGSVYQGAVVVAQNGGAAPVKRGNPWKKYLASESDSWGGDWSAESDTVVPVWRRNEMPPIRASVNRWNVLDPDTASGSTMRHDTVDSVGGGLVNESGVGCIASLGLTADREVDDWEEACE